jgi:hypothetical protein
VKTSLRGGIGNVIGAGRHCALPVELLSCWRAERNRLAQLKPKQIMIITSLILAAIVLLVGYDTSIQEG